MELLKELEKGEILIIIIIIIIMIYLCTLIRTKHGKSLIMLVNEAFIIEDK